MSTWHWLGGESHVTSAQGSALHRPVAESHPATHATSVVVKTQEPSPESHAPPLYTREVFALKHSGSGSGQSGVGPLQAPLPSQMSSSVQMSPSSHGVSAALGVYVQDPFDGLQTPVGS
jgi:hypothetical protein